MHLFGGSAGVASFEARSPGTLRHRLSATLPLSKVLAAASAEQFTTTGTFPVVHQIKRIVSNSQVIAA